MTEISELKRRCAEAFEEERDAASRHARAYQEARVMIQKLADKLGEAKDQHEASQQ